MISKAINISIQNREDSLLVASAVTTMQARAASGGLNRFEITRADLSRQSSGMIIGSDVC